MIVLERIIRPFQTRSVTPPQRIVTADEKTVDNVVVTIGDSGSGQILQGNYSSSLQGYMTKQVKEQIE